LSAQIRVVIADDHPPTRAGIRRTLEDGGFEVCAEVANGHDAVEATARELPDVALLDINMPGGGIAAAHQISGQLPDTAVVMLTVSRDDADLFSALRAGASGYLLKDIAPERLVDSLHAVLEGEAALPGDLVARLVQEFRFRGRRRVPLAKSRGAELTAREWEVLEALRDGLSTAEIAERYRVSPVTIRTHVRAILKKLRVTDRAAAIRLLEER
jgi:DNA-binding NarL/FixJ family response regulator